MRRIIKWVGLACMLLFVGGWAQEARSRAYQERDSGERRMRAEEGNARSRYDSREKRGYHARKAQTDREGRGAVEGRRRYNDRRGRGGYHGGMWGVDRGTVDPHRPPKEESDFCIYGEVFYGSVRLEGGFPESQSWKKEAEASQDTVVTWHPMDWNWSFGGRGGVGWKLRERWGMDISYLWFKNQASSIQNKESDTDLFDFVSPLLRGHLGGSSGVEATLLPSGIALPAKTTRREFSVCYQELAWDLKGFLGNNDPFLASFSLGLLGIWQQQTHDHKATIQFSSPPPNSTTWESPFSEKVEWDVRGIGAQVGAGAFWSLGRIVYLFGEGRIGVSCLRSDMDHRNSPFQLNLRTTGDGEPCGNLQPLMSSERRYRICPFFGVKVGVQLILISKDFQKNFFVQLGWETHFWPKQLFCLNFDGSHRFHDLLMYGATGRVSIGF